MIDKSQRNAARVLGITYPLTFVILTVAFVRYYAPFLVWNNMEETARNLFAHERTVRIYLASALIYGVGLIVLLTALYVILRPVSQGLSLFAAACRLVYAMLWFVTLLDVFGALRFMDSANHMGALSSVPLPALAGQRLASGWDAYYIGLGFYGLGTLIFSYLWFKSHYIPRALAVWGVLSSVFMAVCAFAYLLYPDFGKLVSVNWYEMPTLLFELPTSLWILARGLRPAVPHW